MNQPIEKNHAHVLIARTPLTPLEEITKQLNETIGLTCTLVGCSSLPECLEVLKDKNSSINIILLDLALASVKDSEEFFAEIHAASGGKPIVAFTRPEDRGLALFLVRGGASIVSNENIRRIDSHQLRDVIEYAWIRHGNEQREREINNAEMADQQKRNDDERDYERVQSGDRLKLKDWTISRLRRGNSKNQFEENGARTGRPSNYNDSLKERHSKAIIRERQNAAEALQAEKDAGEERLRDKDQIIAWLRGLQKTDDVGIE